MTPFNNELQVGQPAMIINTDRPENIYLIGSVVVVEHFVDCNENISQFYVGCEYLRNSFKDVVIVSDCKKTGQSTHGTPMVEGFSLFSIRNLMPLPPLGDDVLDISFVDVLENLKVVA